MRRSSKAGGARRRRPAVRPQEERREALSALAAQTGLPRRIEWENGRGPKALFKAILFLQELQSLDFEHFQGRYIASSTDSRSVRLLLIAADLQNLVPVSVCFRANGICSSLNRLCLIGTRPSPRLLVPDFPLSLDHFPERTFSSALQSIGYMCSVTHYGRSRS